MRLGWKMSILFVVLAVGAPLTARAEDADAEFCAMLAGASSDGPERVGDVASGAMRTPAVSVLREVSAGAGYLVLVALSAAPTEVRVTPVPIAGDEAPLREGTRVALDFHARANGVVAISFRAPAGTRYHAALYRLPPPREASLRVRTAAMALRGAGGIGSFNGFGSGGGSGTVPLVHPPDCRASVPEHLGGASPAPRARLGQLTIRGAMPPDAITRVLTGALPSLEHCAETFGAHDLTIRLVVLPTGRVQAARSDDAEPRLGGCVARAARRLEFPSTGARVTAIEVPITFSVP